jgi:hypothetical protein
MIDMAIDSLRDLSRVPLDVRELEEKCQRMRVVCSNPFATHIIKEKLVVTRHLGLSKRNGLRKTELVM